jgi:hypothetical protein
MFHKRKWSVVEVKTAEELADKLTEYTWCGCNGFKLGKYIFLNDSTCADGAQEYGVILDNRQLESLTFSWMTKEKALKIINRVLAGEFDNETFSHITPEQLEHPAGHCVLCM